MQYLLCLLLVEYCTHARKVLAGDIQALCYMCGNQLTVFNDCLFRTSALYCTMSDDWLCMLSCVVVREHQAYGIDGMHRLSFLC